MLKAVRYLCLLVMLGGASSTQAFLDAVPGAGIISGLFSSSDEAESECGSGCVDADTKESFHTGLRCVLRQPYKTPCFKAFMKKITEILGDRVSWGGFFNTYVELPLAMQQKLLIFLMRIKDKKGKELTLDLEILRNALDDSILRTGEYPEGILKELDKTGFKAPIALAKVYYSFSGKGFFGQILKTNPNFEGIKATLFVANEGGDIYPGDWIIIYNFDYIRPWKTDRYDKDNPFLNEQYLKIEEDYDLHNLIPVVVTSYKKYVAPLE